MKIFQTKMIHFVQEEISSKNEALITAVFPLIHNGYVTKKYLDEVVNNSKVSHSHYISSPNTLVIWVDESQEYSIKDGISLTVFNNPISFSHKSKHQIKHAWVIAATSQEQQEKMLTSVKKILSNRKFLKKIDKIPNLADLVNLIEEYDNF